MKVKVVCYVAKGDPEAVREAATREAHGLLVQVADSRSASNEFFVEMLAAQTTRAATSGNLIANKPAIDLLLRLAGTTQISTAISKAGAKKGEPLLVILAGESSQVTKVRVPPGWKRVPRRKLTAAEKDRIEEAALLNAIRG